MKTSIISKRFAALLCCIAVCVALVATALGVNLVSRAQADDAQEDEIAVLSEEPADDIQPIEEEIPAPTEGISGEEAAQAGEPAAAEDAVTPVEEPVSGESEEIPLPEDTTEPEVTTGPESSAEPEGIPEESGEPDAAEPAGSEEPAEPEEAEPDGSDESSEADLNEPGEPDEAADTEEPDAEEPEPDDIDAVDEDTDEDADTEDADDEEDATAEEDEYGIMLLDVVASGTYGADGDGDNVLWELDDDGVLTIWGEGAMKNGVMNSSSPWYSDRASITSVVIEDGVTTIGAYAFVNCSNLTEITIPNTVTSIGGYAFNGCSSLENVTLPNSFTSIGTNAFRGCFGLTNISIPDSVTSIGEYAFRQCTSLVNIEIPASVTSIEYGAFYGCTALTNIDLPDGLTELDGYVFYNCSSLTTVDLPAAITEIGADLFYGCTSLISVTAQSPITSISTSAFNGCTSLETVFDLSQVTYMGTNTFYNCSSLTGTIDLSSLTTIDTNNFYGCSSISGVIFNDQLASIGNYAFYRCNNIRELSLPEGLQTIGNYAFWNCFLNGNSMIATTEVSSGAAVYSIDSGRTDMTTETTEYTGHTLVIPSTVTSVGTGAFDASYVDIFVIGSNLTSITGSSFASSSLQAIIFDNFQDLVNIDSYDAVVARTSSADVSLVYRRGGTGIYLNGVDGDDNNNGTKDYPVATYERAQEIAVEEGLSYIIVSGTVTVSDIERWDGGLTLYRDTGFTDDDLIVVSGSGNLTLTDITIDGQNVASSGSLVLVQGADAQLTITDGAVIQNSLSSSTGNMAEESAAVTVRNGSLTMTGGQIRNSAGATFGGGVSLLGNGSDINIHMDFTGGTISGNSAVFGGGIYLYGNATLTMAGGTIDSNAATNNGGGIFVGAGAVAEISSGYITNNRQTTRDTSYGGGGIYVDSGTTDSTGVWPAGSLYINNAEITDNSFTRVGDAYLGTIACCETGTLSVYITKGAVIHDNSENMTFYVTRDSGSLAFTLPAIMLGGGAYNWIDYSTGEPIDLDGLTNSTGNVHAVTYVSTSDGTVTGIDRCTTFITGNVAVNMGSAIGTNGNVVIGYNDGDVTIDIEKVWNVNDATPESITVYVDATDGYGVTTRVGSVVLNEENGWKVTVDELPKYDSDGLEYTYTVSEETLGGMIGELTGGKVSSSGDDYDTDVDKTASYAFTFTNSSAVELSLTKDAEGTRAPETFEFEITLTQENGEPFNGDVTASYIISSGDIRSDRTGVVSFTDGKATVEIASGETVALLLPIGLDCSITELTTGADTVVVTDGNGNVIASIEGTTTQAVAALGTIHESTQVTFTNSYREYFDIDEEIVVDESDRNTWVKDEAVNEYNAIEIEMSTYLPVVTAYDIENGEFTMNFHEQLNSQLVLDEVDADFSVAIAGYRISHDYYTVTIDPDDGCTFHVDVDLSALYNDGIITEDDLQGDTEIMVFFFADLEGTGLNGTYESTVWYDVYDADEILYTSEVDVVYVYTYEIEILKIDAETGEALSGAMLGVYYDSELSEPVSRNGEPYTVTSGDDGYAMFYGLADGTYYIAEVAAPDGYLLSADVLEVVLNENTVDDNYIYRATFGNTPIPETISITVTKVWNDADNQDSLQPESITVQLLADGGVIDEQILSADNGWSYTWDALDAYENGETVSYSVIEPETPDGYGQSNSGLVDNGDGTYSVTITNTHIPEGAVSEPKKTVDVGTGTEITPGESLIYTITYTNGSEDGATVTITDVLNEGLDFVSATEGGTYDEATRTVTWTITGVAAYAEGSVSLTVIVNESALTVGEISNTATVQINDNPAVSTDTPTNPVETPTTVTFDVVKVWDDNNDLYGERPELIVVVLLENGRATTLTQLLSAENSWTGTYSDLPEYDENGEKIVYSIAEVTVPNYTSVITGDQDSGFTVTNTYDFDEITNPEPGNPDGGNPEPGNPNSGNPEPGVPQTGQDSLPIAPIAVSGAAIIAAGVALLVIRRRRAA